MRFGRILLGGDVKANPVSTDGIIFTLSGLGIPQQELESTTGEREVLASFFSFCLFFLVFFNLLSP